MPGTSPGMTTNVVARGSANALATDWQGGRDSQNGLLFPVIPPIDGRYCAIGNTPLLATRLCSGGFACQNEPCRRIPLHAPNQVSSYTHPAWLILILSLAPTIGLGIGRFAYALVLPDMRDSLGWSYSAAGFMNTINAVGYLIGALLASRAIQRFGLARTVRWGTLAAVTSLALSAVSGNFVVLSFARLLAGIGAAGGFVGGAALAATIAQSRPDRANFLLSLFYAGPGVGILSSGLIAPFVLQGFGPGSWWIVWWAMTLLSVVLIMPLLLAPFGSAAAIDNAAPAKFSVRPVLMYLIGYFLFGAGYIAYMTFMIAYVRDGGGGAAAQSLFWSLIGASAFVTPWVWRRVLAMDRGGLTTTIILGVNAMGAALPIFGHSPLLLALSALVFGVAFFAVVGSTTAFVRFNYPPSGWPMGIAAMTISFGIGQTLGPIVVGAITDAMGSLSVALNVSAALLALGAILSAFQRKLKRANGE
jgi:predicted MFS family arabinose efflux permease